MMRSAIIEAPWKKQCRALFTGFGFTLAFGWLWFASLRALWLSGQTSNFSYLVLAGFFAGLLGICTIAWLLQTPLNNATPLFLACMLHGRTALFLLVAFFLSEQPLLFPVALGISGAGTGLFWTIALLRQIPEQITLAFAGAQAAALLLSLGSHLFPQLSSATIFWVPVALYPTVAWIISLFGIRSEEWGSNTFACASYKDTENNCLPYRHYFVLVLVFFAFSLFLLRVGKAHQTHLWTHDAAHVLGAMLAYIAWRFWVKPAALPKDRGNGMLICAFGIFCFANIALFPPTFWVGKSILVGALEGTALGVVALCFAKGTPVTTFFIVTRAALVLALIFMATNIGALVGSILTASGSLGEQVNSSLLYFIAAVLLVIATLQKRIPPQTSKDETAPVEYPPVETLEQTNDIDERYKKILTEKEYTLALLISQGVSNKSIVKITGTTNNTVRWHLKNLHRKTNSKNRAQLIATLINGNQSGKQ